MIHHYGTMTIDVDAKTGRGKVVREDQAKLGNIITTKRTNGYDSKLEARYSRYLDCLVFTGEVRRYVYHPFTVHLAPKLKYTPDFLCEGSDGMIVLVELKGHERMKNARDSISRLKMAAGKFPFWTWTLVTLLKGEWMTKTMGGSAEVGLRGDRVGKRP